MPNPRLIFSVKCGKNYGTYLVYVEKIGNKMRRDYFQDASNVLLPLRVAFSLLRPHPKLILLKVPPP